jgi:hypothetical protein
MLAVCVDDVPYSPSGRPFNLVKGEVYLVAAVIRPRTLFAPEYALVIDGRVSINPDGEYCPSRFRPAVQDDQACEDEFIVLLKNCKPTKAPVLTPNRHERVGYINSQSTSALPTVVPAGAADCGALPHTPSAVGNHSGPDSCDHALGGHSQTDCFPVHRSDF